MTEKSRLGALIDRLLSNSNTIKVLSGKVGKLESVVTDLESRVVDLEAKAADLETRVREIEDFTGLRQSTFEEE